MFTLACIGSLLAIIIGALLFALAGIWEAVIWSRIFTGMTSVKTGDLDAIAQHERLLSQAHLWRIAKFSSVGIILVGFCVLWALVYVHSST